MVTLFGHNVPMYTFRPGPVPSTPTNITIRQQRNGLMISWMYNREENSVPISMFKIEFRTVGQWVQLSTVPAERTWYLWDTVSRGATYHFRVFAMTEKTHSKPSKPVTFFTGGMYARTHARAHTRTHTHRQIQILHSWKNDLCLKIFHRYTLISWAHSVSNM